MGQLGMNEDEFWSCTPRAFFNRVEGFTSLRKTDLEVQRLQTLCLVNMWASKPLKDPRQLWTYPWEKVLLTEEDLSKIRQKADKWAEKIERIEKRHERQSSGVNI